MVLVDGPHLGRAGSSHGRLCDGSLADEPLDGLRRSRRVRAGAGGHRCWGIATAGTDSRCLKLTLNSQKWRVREVWGGCLTLVLGLIRASGRAGSASGGSIAVGHWETFARPSSGRQWPQRRQEAEIHVVGNSTARRR